jgi:hypothetical protein
MNEPLKQFEKELPGLISSEEYVDGTLDLIDALLKDAGPEILDAIPVAKSLHALYRAGNNISDRYFLRKLANFLLQLKQIPKYERDKYLDKIQHDQKERDKIGPTLIILLDRFDDLKKPELLARVFEAFMREEIDLETFRRMGSAIDKCFVSDLHKLENLSASDELHPTTAATFYSSGFTILASVLPGDFSGGLTKFHITDFGKEFLRIIK